ncbi:MAG: alpha/beta fold hydrolase [Polyangiales bacterium]
MRGERAVAPFEPLPFSRLPERPRKAHGFFGMRAREVVVPSAPFGRLRVHVRELGDGPPLLLVHGLMTSSYSWRYVVEPLARRYRVIAPDLPGAGRSDKPVDRPYGARALATFVGELVDALGIGGCEAIGNSLGGYLCMWLALERPEALSRLVDIHSPGVPDARLRALHAALRAAPARRALEWVIARDPERWAHRNVHCYDETLKSLEEAREYGAPLRTPEGRRAFVRWLAEALDPAEMTRLCEELAARRDDGRGFPIPLELLYAREDPMVPPSVGEQLHALVPEAPLRWLDHSSHFAQVDTPQALL